MHLRFLAAAAVAGFVLFLPARVDAACCEQKAHQHQPNAVDFLLSLDPAKPAVPVRQVADVWFTRPTLIGRAIVQGHYVIEHDNDRMMRGEPCTHVYAFNDRETPVATFHCTHLERDRTAKNVVTLFTMPDGMQKLTEFQFAGEPAAHGYPDR